MQLDHPIPGECCTELGADTPRKPLHIRLYYRFTQYLNHAPVSVVLVLLWVLGFPFIGVPLLAAWALLAK